MTHLFAKREYGPHPTIKGVVLHGQWVVRDFEGTFIDNDKYRGDLADRYNDTIAFIDNHKISWVDILKGHLSKEAKS